MVLVKDGKQQIWVRSLDAVDMTPLAGTDDAAEPFWSPDSRFLAFFADSKLKKIERTGGGRRRRSAMPWEPRVVPGIAKATS